MKKLNGTIKMTGVKFNLNINVAEISFKEEYSRKSQDMKRNFSHTKATDIKISLDEEVEEITFTMDALNDMIKEAGKQVLESVKEVAEPVEAQQPGMIRFCYEILSDKIVPSAKDARAYLKVNFNYTDSQLDGRDVICLLRRECKHYLVKEIESR